MDFSLNRRSRRRIVAFGALSLSTLGLLAMPAEAVDRNIGNLGKVQIEALCAGTGGHYEAASGGAYGCEGPGVGWLIRCGADGACIIENGIGRLGSRPLNGGLVLGSVGGSTLSGGTGSTPPGGPTTGGPTTGGGTGGSGGCICNQIGGGPNPPSSPITVNPVPTGFSSGLKQLAH